MRASKKQITASSSEEISRRKKAGKGQLLSMMSLIPLSACGGGASPAPTQPPPAPNAAPTDITVSALTIAENSTTPTVIGTVTTTDADSTSHTYTVSDARFEVVGGELRLKAGSSLNYETILGSGSTAEITLDITTRDGSSNTYTETFTITVTDVNDAPSSISLAANTVNENAAGAVIGTLSSVDEDAVDTVTYSVSDARFEIVGDQLKLKAGVSLDFETASSIVLDVTATDAAGLTFTQQFTITVTDVNEAPSAISLNVASVSEKDAAAVIGTLTTTDVDAGDTVSYSVSDARFEVVGGELKLKSGVFLDYATASSILIDVTATDGGGLTFTQQFTITVEAVPTDIAVSALSVAENQNSYVVIGTVTTTDADSASHTYTVSDARFEVVGGELRLKAGNSLDYETIPGATISVDITTSDSEGNSYVETFVITVTDVNDAPTAISLSAATARENDAGVVIGTLTTTDQDAVDTAAYSVSDARFEVVGGQLKLKAGVSLDFEVASSISLDVTVTDSGGLTFTQQFTITVEDVTELAGFAVTGIAAGDNSGWSVSNVGDVNGDGIDDIIIGANLADPNATNGAGQSYVVFGSSAGFSASFDLSTLDGTNGFVVNGINVSAQSGYSVSSAGDVNGDGIDDILIGAPAAPGYGFAVTAGESYVVFGSNTAFAASMDISALDGTNGFIINGLLDNDSFGVDVSAAGDVNGDGIDDIIIGAFSADPAGNADAGESYVIFGSDAGFTQYFDPSILDGTNGFVLSGINAGDNSGVSVSNAGDVNGDGIDDVIIGAVYADPNGLAGAGESYVVFGSNAGFAANIDLSTLDGSNGFAISSVEAGDTSGFSVSSAGDVNGDGIDDIIIGELGNAATSNESYVIFGSNTGFGATLSLGSLDGTNGFIINGITTGDRTGYSVSSAGDVNGDGFDDILVGAPASDANAGESYVIFGSDQAFSANLDLSTLDGSNGFALQGALVGDSIGWSVSAAGDVNDDGVDDIIIGAPYGDPGGVNAAGESYVIFGSTSSWQAVYDLSWIGKTIFSSTAAIDVFDATDTADVFDFDTNWNDDTVTGFQDGVDLLDLSDTGLVFADLTISQTGGDTLIEEAGGNSIILIGITSTDITVDDFIF